MTQKIRLLLVDDHALVREGMRAFFALTPHIEVIGEAQDGEEAVRLAEELRPDVILMDLLLPRMDGIQAASAILQRDPQARILMLTSFAYDDQVLPAMRAGARGYMLKDATAAELIQAVEDVYRGRTSVHPLVVEKLIKGLQQAFPHADADALTEREKDVLALLAEGLSNHEMARRLNLSEWTVRTHVRNILAKLQLENRTQAALYAIRKGLAELPPPREF